MHRAIPFAFASLAALAFVGEAAAQAYDPASGRSPIVLLQTAPDGVAYWEMFRRAREANETQDWAEAERLWEELVRQYPRNGEAWMLLGRARLRLHKGRSAAVAYLTAAEILGGDGEFPNRYRAAAALLDAGDKPAAFAILRETIEDRHGFLRQDLADVFTPWFDTVRDDPEFREITGHPDTTGWTRNEGWLHDLDYLYNETKRINVDYRDRPFPAEVQRRYDALRRDIPTLSEEQIYFRMKLMLAPLRQGHISFWPGPTSRFLPIRFYAFPEGIFVMDAADKSLIGSRVVTIGSLPAEEAWRRLSEAGSVDGDMQHVWDVFMLAATSDLIGMGAINNPNTVALGIQPASGGPVRSVSVDTVDTIPTGSQSERWDRMAPPAEVSPPLFLSQMSQVFWHTTIPGRQSVYVQINNLMDSPDESLADYGRRLWNVLAAERPNNLILDLRHNNGGTTQDYPEVLRTVIAFSRIPGNQVYVLIGRRSYSATGNFVTDLERLVSPLFVGEATSECCRLHGDPIPVALPYSGVRAELTGMVWQLSTPSDLRREMSPHVPVQLTAADYFAGRDPALDSIFRLIDRPGDDSAGGQP